jgi:hypothetical protein
MVGLGPITLCCQKRYTFCTCPEAQLPDEPFELPVKEPEPSRDERPTFELGKVYPGTPETWRRYLDNKSSRRWISGFEVIDEAEES